MLTLEQITSLISLVISIAVLGVLLSQWRRMQSGGEHDRNWIKILLVAAVIGFVLAVFPIVRIFFPF
ncbi:hypothetical protein D6779_12035 [Candidatus Parcubacteria bacterium]|nr:MAG: hypothetical protein D6779_12035 [Candidatus Parcubacteria bacterium]